MTVAGDGAGSGSIAVRKRMKLMAGAVCHATDTTAAALTEDGELTIYEDNPCKTLEVVSC